MNIPDKKTIRAVFLDLDGTVFSYTSGTIPSSAEKAIAALRTKGILVFIATGRHIQELKWLKLDDFPVDGWITVNGAYCYNNKGMYYSKPIDAADIRTLVVALSADPFPCMFLTDTEIFINMDDARVRASQVKIHTPMPDIRPAESALEQEIYMLVPYAEDSRWQPVRDKLKHVQDTRWTNLALDV